MTTSQNVEMRLHSRHRSMKKLAEKADHEGQTADGEHQTPSSSSPGPACDCATTGQIIDLLDHAFTCCAWTGRAPKAPITPIR